MNGKVRDQLAHGDAVWLVTAEEWSNYSKLLVEREKFPIRHGKILMPLHPSGLSLQQLGDFAKYCVNKIDNIKTDEKVQSYNNLNEGVSEDKRDQRCDHDGIENHTMKVETTVNTVTIGAIGAQQPSVRKPTIDTNLAANGLLVIPRPKASPPKSSAQRKLKQQVLVKKLLARNEQRLRNESNKMVNKSQPKALVTATPFSSYTAYLEYEKSVAPKAPLSFSDWFNSSLRPPLDQKEVIGQVH